VKRAPRFAARLALTLAVALATALMVAVALGVFDLYLTGHSLPSLGRPWVEAPGVGVSMSRSDVILWVLVFGTAAVTWGGSGRVLPKRD